MKCPKCGRDTYSKKWDSCVACGPDKPTIKKFTGIVVPDSQVTPVTGPMDVITSVTEPGPDEECPTCHRKMPSKNAVRQAAYRGRKA
jgi:RNA polymerase subunit RPABC4/transcription elongation factor Spt4